MADRLTDASVSPPNRVCNVMAGVGVGVLVALGVGVVVATSPSPRINNQIIAAIKTKPVPSRAYRRHLPVPDGLSGTEINGAFSSVTLCFKTGDTNGWGGIFNVWGREGSGCFAGGIVIFGIDIGASRCVGKLEGGVGILGATGLGAGGIAGLGALSCINCLGAGVGAGLVITFSISLPAGFCPVFRLAISSDIVLILVL